MAMLDINAPKTLEIVSVRWADSHQLNCHHVSSNVHQPHVIVYQHFIDPNYKHTYRYYMYIYAVAFMHTVWVE